MECFHLALDAHGQHTLVLIPHETQPHLRLCRSLSDRFSRLHVALRRHLRVLIDHQPYVFSDATDILALPQFYEHITIHLGAAHAPPLMQRRSIYAR